jgi:erythromycin esterase-like protein
MKAPVTVRYCLAMLSLVILACKGPATLDAPSVKVPHHPLQTEQDLDALVSQIGDKKIVLLGEASHGTAEYYTWRTAITKRLIQEKGFGIIAVEGEWADSYRVNQFIKGGPKDSLQVNTLLMQYNRWPTWMWGNHEVARLVGWLNGYNQEKLPSSKASFYGLDVYCLWESMEELMPYIQENDSLARMAREVMTCFQPFSADAIQYAHAVRNASENCRTQTLRLYQAILNYTAANPISEEAKLILQQNSLVALNGEKYYSAAATSNTASWNIRDRHMAITVKRLMDHHGPTAKMIIWAHNTHVGDARATDMAAAGMTNLGQMIREFYGQENVYIVGFGSYSGKVTAADAWGGSIRTMRVPKANRGSWEEILHSNGPYDKLLFSNELRKHPLLIKSMGHRAIGVQYNPASESRNYVPSIIPDRYDAFLFFDETSALRPLPTKRNNEPPDTYPSGY